METIAEIRAAIAAKTVSITDLSRASGVSRKTLYRVLEPGYLPNLRTLHRVGQALAAVNCDTSEPVQK